MAGEKEELSEEEKKIKFYWSAILKERQEFGRSVAKRKT